MRTIDAHALAASYDDDAKFFNHFLKLYSLNDVLGRIYGQPTLEPDLKKERRHWILSPKLYKPWDQRKMHCKAVLSESEDGWRKELTCEKKTDGVPTVELCEWRKGHTERGMAVSLDEDEQKRLFAVLAEEFGKDMLITWALSLVTDFCRREFSDESDEILYYGRETVEDFSTINLAFTTTDDGEHNIQVVLDLTTYQVNKYLDGCLVEQTTYQYLATLIERELENLEFERLVSLTKEQLQGKLIKKTVRG